MTHLRFPLLAALLAAWLPTAGAQQASQNGQQPAPQKLHDYLLAEADKAFAKRKAAYEQIKTAEDIAAYQQRTRQFFLDQIGQFPERTPLNPQITGRVIRDGFTVEKIIFESRPKHYVTAAMFLPDEAKYKPPYPGVLLVCGHSANGKANEGYQSACALLALNGVAALVVDPIGQGERYQLVEPDGKLTIGKPTAEHSLLGLGSIFLGRNTAQFEIWDGMRGIDYLQSRPEIDPKRIGCMGNSGGGTQSSYLMALDERIACASPSCYITSFERLINTIGPQDAEQNIAGQIAFGMDHADYVMLRAPRPTLICCATHDYFDITGTWNSFRQAKRLYTRTGFAERVNLVENDAKHGYSQPLREAAVRWMVRWLREEDRDIHEPPIDVLSDKEIQCTPRGQVMLIDGAVSAFDINRQENKRLAGVRKEFWQKSAPEEVRAAVREIAGIRPRAEVVGQALRERVTEGREYSVANYTLKREGNINLPLAVFAPAKAKDDALPVVFVSESGFKWASGEGGGILPLVAAGHTVFAVDVRGISQTGPTAGGDVTIAYLLDKSLVGMWAEDIIAAADFASREAKSDTGRVDLIATGKLGPAALHAAFVEPELFRSVRLENSLASYSSIVKIGPAGTQWVQQIHGALQTYDLPDLSASLGDRVEWIDPVDAAGEPVELGGQSKKK